MTNRGGCRGHGVTCSWVDIVGYRYEVLHTGVLRTLLGYPRDGRAQGLSEVVAGILIGETVRAVGELRQEHRAGAKVKADLVVEVEAASGAAFDLAVECKVDSGWTRGQLEQTLGEAGQRGVLFAMGLTALAVEPEDLPSDRWALVSVRDWANALTRLDARLPNPIREYVRHLEAEVRAHVAARQAAHEVRELRYSFRTGTDALANWGYFAEVLDGLGADRAFWDRKTLISGPLLTRWLSFASDLNYDADAAVYLEFMAYPDQRRDLRIKVGSWSDTSRLPALLEAVQGWLADSGYPTTRPPSRPTKSATAARIELNGAPPAKAAQRAGELRTQLASFAPEALRAAFS